MGAESELTVSNGTRALAVAAAGSPKRAESEPVEGFLLLLNLNICENYLAGSESCGRLQMVHMVVA
jgi:hypothetical protein